MTSYFSGNRPPNLSCLTWQRFDFDFYKSNTNQAASFGISFPLLPPLACDEISFDNSSLEILFICMVRREKEMLRALILLLTTLDQSQHNSTHIVIGQNSVTWSQPNRQEAWEMIFQCAQKEGMCGLYHDWLCHRFQTYQFKSTNMFY